MMRLAQHQGSDAAAMAARRGLGVCEEVKNEEVSSGLEDFPAVTSACEVRIGTYKTLRSTTFREERRTDERSRSVYLGAPWVPQIDVMQQDLAAPSKLNDPYDRLFTDK